MVIVNEKQLVFASTFLLPDDKPAVFDVSIGGKKVGFNVRFTGGEGMIGQWTLLDSVISMEFKGWRSSLGTAISEPQFLGDVGGITFFFQMAQSLIGDQNLVHFFVLTAGPQ